MTGRRKHLDPRQCEVCGMVISPLRADGSVDYQHYAIRNTCSQECRWARHANVERTRRDALKAAIQEAGEQPCRRCGEVKELEQFSLTPAGNYRRVCKHCRSTYQGQYISDLPEEAKASNKVKQRAARLMNQYGLTLGEFDFLLAVQDDGCAICGKTTEENGQNLAVDHNHVTGEIRGLLCSRCNALVVSRWLDDPRLSEGLSMYITIPPAQDIWERRTVPNSRKATENRWTGAWIAQHERRDT